jgi:hypothetical protein
VVASPIIENVVRRSSARHPVHDGAAADARARKQRHRAVPCRHEATIQEQRLDPLQLAARHGPLVDERSRLEDDN